MTSSDKTTTSKAGPSPTVPAPGLPADLNVVLEAWTASWRADLPENLSLVWQRNSAPLRTTVPAPLIRHTVETLLQRARHAIGNQPGRVVLQLRASEPDEDIPLDADLAHPFIVISVGDDRPAAPDDHDDTLESLRTALAARHGALDLIRLPGQGTVCRILLPATTLEQARRLRAPYPARILMVEDEWTIAAPAKLFLERAGYQVVTAPDAEQALALVREGRWTIDLLLTDIVLPGMNGHLLLRTLRTEHPDLPCLFMSGYTAESLNDLQQGLHRTLFIGKPFSSEQLLTTIHSILAPPGVAGNPERP